MLPVQFMKFLTGESDEAFRDFLNEKSSLVDVAKWIITKEKRLVSTYERKVRAWATEPFNEDRALNMAADISAAGERLFKTARSAASVGDREPAIKLAEAAAEIFERSAFAMRVLGGHFLEEAYQDMKNKADETRLWAKNHTRIH